MLRYLQVTERLYCKDNHLRIHDILEAHEDVYRSGQQSQRYSRVGLELAGAVGERRWRGVGVVVVVVEMVSWVLVWGPA